MGIGLSDSGLVELNRRHPNVSILKAEGAVLTVARLAEAAAGAFTLFNGRNGMELLDSLRAGCAGLIPGVETCDVQSRIDRKSTRLNSSHPCATRMPTYA